MLRRPLVATSEQAQKLQRLVADGQARIIGAIRQEVLSGIRHADQFRRVRDRLRFFPDVPLGDRHFERAAELYNLCRGKGIQGSNTDMLICAVAEIEGFRIYTADGDFARFARHVPVQLL